jgi:hypothetical protein
MCGTMAIGTAGDAGHTSQSGLRPRTVSSTCRMSSARYRSSGRSWRPAARPQRRAEGSSAARPAVFSAPRLSSRLHSRTVAPSRERDVLPVPRDFTFEKWSGRQDSNLRPPAPKAGALPGCATPRSTDLDFTVFQAPSASAARASTSELQVSVPRRSSPMTWPARPATEPRWSPHRIRQSPDREE